MHGNADRFSQNKLKKYFGMFDEGSEIAELGTATEVGGGMRGEGV